MRKITCGVVDIQKKLQKSMDAQRFVHTLGVAYTATSLAMVHGIDIKQARLAGLLHDCAKSISVHNLLRLCRINGIKISAYEQANPSLLHAKAGALIARSKYKVIDSEVLDAIRFHTTGKPAMSTLGKIIYIADFIEPNRKELDCLDAIRKVSFANLDEGMYLILKNILEWLDEENKVIDDMSRSAFAYYANIHKDKESACRLAAPSALFD